ncbi:MAG: RagB/SusD family nutrient uptake outer membrane protein [Prolixibacteraceae bacterium]|jgi:tetratricopeptide (TPR) repeat protein|nr:RagB/SusD family nutrient uptake outer membrane protein [Prolixibacteraceae bacterium]
MKNIVKWICLLSVAILFSTSCSDDFFNEIPSDRITPDQHYNSKIEADISTMAPLAVLKDVVPHMIFNNELLADLATPTANADINIENTYNHVLTLDNPNFDPSDFYKAIVNTNEALQYIDSIIYTDRDMKEIDVKIYKGNLIGLRSWCYFNLGRLYGEVAYFKNNLSSYSPEDITYISREAVLDTLINDLLPYLDIDFFDIGNLTMYNKALIGEIYLEKQDYTNAITYLQMAIEGFENLVSMYKLSSIYSKDRWFDIFLSSFYRTSEVMAAIPYSFVNNQPNTLEMWYSYEFDYLAKPSDICLNYFNTQIGINGKEGDRFRGDSYTYYQKDEDLVVNKYNNDQSVSLSSDIILYRATDIHLLLAEAYNRVGEFDIALDILNDGHHDFTNWANGMGVRGRVSLAPRTVPEGADQMLTIEDFIIEERACELAFEGKRWFDLMRIARRRGTSYLADKVAAKYTNKNIAEKVKTHLENEENWYLPFKK